MNSVVTTEVSKWGWRTEGVGPRRSFLCQRFRPLFWTLFPCVLLRRRGTQNSGDTFLCCVLGSVRRQPPRQPLIETSDYDYRLEGKTNHWDCISGLFLGSFGSTCSKCCPLWPKIGCSFLANLAYSWKLLAHSGAFLLTVDNFSYFAYSWSFFTYNFSFFTCSWSCFGYSGKVRLISALRDCKQRSLTVSKKAPTASKKASPPKNRF